MDYGDVSEDPILAQRRAWFHRYTDRVHNAARRGPEFGVRFACPCCGYRTLFQRGADDICPLCNWQDDGQDDPHADETWGGPNKEYSLTQARQNFRRYLVMIWSCTSLTETDG